MTVCPNCGAELPSPKMPAAPAKTAKPQPEAAATLKLVKCPVCKTTFLTRTQPAEPTQTVNVKNGTARIRAVWGEFVQTLKALREKIETLEKERAGLLAEIEALRVAAEARAAALEAEVGQMRADVKGLRELVGSAKAGVQPSVTAEKAAS